MCSAANRCVTLPGPHLTPGLAAACSGTPGGNADVNRLNGNRAYRDLWAAAAGGLGYMLLALGTILLTSNERGISTLWAANALLLAIILPLERRRWPIYFVAAFIGNATANLLTRGSLAAPLLFGMANMAEVLIAAILLQHWQAFSNPLANVRSVLRFALFAGLIAPALSGLGGAAAASFMFGQPFWAGFSTWYIADSLLPPGQIPNYPADQTKVFCNASDGVCSGTLAVTAGHLTYTADVDEAVEFLQGTITSGASSTGTTTGGSTGTSAATPAATTSRSSSGLG
ncbi:MAG: cutinase family protein, partial [Burkholderiales bacterium]